MLDTDELNPEQRQAAEAVAGLAQPAPPADLTDRTLARIVSECPPYRKVFWMLRPITHPLLRLATAAAIVLAIVPLRDLNTASAIGAKIEQKIIGPQVTDRLEHFVDRLLTLYGNPAYSQNDLDEFMGVQRVPEVQRRPPTKRVESPDSPQV